MLDFILILLFSKTVLLTPDPVTIDQRGLVVKDFEPISAITSGASIQIDVSRMLIPSGEVGVDVIAARKLVSDTFPEDSIEVVLVSDNENKKIRLAYKGASLINEKSIRLVLYGEDMPTDIDFNEVAINTAIELKDVQLYWRNYKK